MGEVKEYPNGTFCWIDLGTADLAGAKVFYGELLGWQFEEVADGYVLARRDGMDVAGMHAHTHEEGTGWASSISVGDVDAATARAAELGAAVAMEPSDLPGTARISLIHDPAGAEVCLWQAAGYAGARLVNEVGTWSWNELVTPDLAAAAAFYGALLGWTSQAAPGGIERASFELGDLLIGGAHAATEFEQGPPSWTVSFRVADADTSAGLAASLGGAVPLPPIDIPVGRVAILADPAGAPFTIAEVPGGALRGVDGS